MKKYTLDRIESDHYVFLEKPEEIHQLVIPTEQCKIPLAEGDIVNITYSSDDELFIEILQEETALIKNKASALIEKLKRK